MRLAGSAAGAVALVGVLMTSACASSGQAQSGSTGGSPGRSVTLRVTVGRAPQPLTVPPGSRITVEFPPNPLGTWTSPEISNPSVAHVHVRRRPAGVTVRIYADAPGATRVAVHTTPSGDPRPPGKARALDWVLNLTVSA